VARILYAFSAQGRGHRSRATTVGTALRGRGHSVRYICGGWAKDELKSEGEDPLEVPVLRQILVRNRVRLAASIAANYRKVLGYRATVDKLSRNLASESADLLITDFEAFSARAAAKIGLPTLSFNHQQIVTHTRYSTPLRHRSEAAFTRAIINLIAPTDPVKVLISSFYYPSVRDPKLTSLIPPIVRPSVERARLTAKCGEHILVYHNDSAGEEGLLEQLKQVDCPFIVYGFQTPRDNLVESNLRFRTPSNAQFLADLASSRGVLCTAGYTLMSEALHLGKPLLVTPNQGIFEQLLNSLFLEREGFGLATIGRQPKAEDLRRFLAREPEFRKRIAGQHSTGNDRALDVIEQALGRCAPPRTK